MKKHGFVQDGFSYIRHYATALQKGAHRIVALALSVCMMATLLPAAAFAEGEILAPEQTPVSVSASDSTVPTPAAPETPATPPAPQEPAAPSAPQEPAAPSAPQEPAAPSVPQEPETPAAPSVPETPAAPPAPQEDAVPPVPQAPSVPQEGAVPPTPAASDSTAAASGSETLVPESDPSAPADSGVTQQSPTPRGAEAVYNIGAADPTDVIATLSADKTTLTITGTGAMMGWSTGDDMPWYPAVTTITTVKIGDGVT
ncbi:MAG: hypothetical protein RR859_09135, partial [Ruthenibacterium sp.]